MSMLRSVLAYMGLGPDEDYEDDYLYGSERAARSRRVGHDDDGELTIDLRDDPDVGLVPRDPHSQRPRPPDWLAPSDEDDELDEVIDEQRAARPAEAASNSSAARTRARAEREPRPTRSRSSRSAPSAPRTEPIVARGGAGSGAVASEAFEAVHEVDDEIEKPPALRAVPNPEPVDEGVSVVERSESTSRYVKPQLLAPQSFGDAKELADLFKDATPVIMNLQGIDRDLARRLIDFASGICYALDGSMEKVASQVFLLTPASVEVSDDERERMASRAYGR
ncbi:MAG: cell division protein SepF [Actinomycetota bacterium]